VVWLSTERADPFVLWQHFAPFAMCFRRESDQDVVGYTGVGLYLSAAKLFAMVAAYIAFPHASFVGVVHQLEAAFRRAALDLRAPPSRRVRAAPFTLPSLHTNLCCLL
jgi:hypothetical protein